MAGKPSKCHRQDLPRARSIGNGGIWQDGEEKRADSPMGASRAAGGRGVCIWAWAGVEKVFSGRGLGGMCL
jgi:hypothetical protein